MSEVIQLIKAKKHVLCIATKPWSNLPDRTQDLMSHWKNVEILYFSPGTKENNHPRKQKVQSNITAYILPKQRITSTDYNLFYKIQQKRLAGYITRIMHKHQIENPLLWLTHPTQEELSNHINYSTLIYDCSQIWENQYQSSQEYLFRKVDLIFSPSKTLKKQLLFYHRNIIILENSVNYPLFEQALLFQKDQPQKNTFGFAGILDYDTDLSPLLFLVKEKPLWNFCILGSCPYGNPDLNQLKTFQNFTFYQEEHPHILAEFLFSCQVLLEFQQLDYPLQDITSKRIYEYLATGRPIVAHLPQTKSPACSNMIYHAVTNQDLLDQCHRALHENDEVLQKKRQNFAKKNSCQARCEKIEQLLTTTGLL